MGPSLARVSALRYSKPTYDVSQSLKNYAVSKRNGTVKSYCKASFQYQLISIPQQDYQWKEERLFDNKMGCEDSRIASETTFQEPRLRFKPFIQRKQQSDLLQSMDSRPRDSLNQLIREDFTMSDDDLEMIEGVLMSHPLFYKTRSFAGREIIDRLEKLVAESNQTIFSKNEDSDYFYIVVEGLICISDFGDNLGSKFIERGHYFGDLGLANKAKRSATAKAIMKTKLLALKRDDFLRVSLELSRKIQKEAYKEIKNIKAFSYLKLNQKHRMSFFALELKFPKGAVIFREGENSDCFFVVKSGKVKITVPDKEAIEILPRQSFGESCLRKQKTVRSADAVCSQNSIIYAFSRYDIDRYMGRSLMQLQYCNKIQWALRHEHTLKLNQTILEGMVELKETTYFRDGQLVVRKGAPINNLIISLQGGVGQYKELEIINLNLLSDLRHHIEDLHKVGNGNVVMISIPLVEEKFNRKIKQLFNKESILGQINESEQILMDYTKELLLEKLKIIGKKQYDGFGHTLKVRDQSNVQFLLRAIQKSLSSSIAKAKALKMLKTVSSDINHFLIAKTYKIFQDQSNFYFLSKSPSGDYLSNYLQSQPKLPINTVRHYAACLITIIEYLHCKKILWKDMKIQSLFIDSEGYLNLIDLLHLEQLEEEEFYMETKSKDNFWYLPPETIAGQAYGFQSDFWSVGVLIYRMLVGYFPFGQHLKAEDPQVLSGLWEDIQEQGLNIPNWLTSDVKMLLKTLLNTNYIERSLLTIGRIKSMSFFKDYDWLGLLQKKVRNIPYYPRKVSKEIVEEISIEAWKKQQQKDNEATTEDPFSHFEGK